MDSLELKHNPRIISYNDSKLLGHELSKLGLTHNEIAEYLTHGQFLALKIDNLSPQQAQLIRKTLLPAGIKTVTHTSTQQNPLNMILFGTAHQLNYLDDTDTGVLSNLDDIGTLIKQTIKGLSETAVKHSLPERYT
jgi:hypothetical protein